MEKVIGILEEGSGYPKRLARYINDRHDIGCVAVAFQNMEEVLCFKERTPISALLVGEGSYSHDDWQKLSALFGQDGQLWQLSEEPTASGQLLPSGMRHVFRYQRAGELIRQVLRQEAEPAKLQGGLYTVYCPGSDISAERFAWQLAKRLSAHGRTLFLSWEPFGGFGRSEAQMGGAAGDMSELLYLLRLEGFSKKERLLALPAMEGVSYVPGVAYCTDLWQYSAEELLCFLALCRECGYQNIVFMAGFFSESIESLMEQSEAVCLVGGEGAERERRRKEFFRQMKYAGKQALLSRIKEVGEWDAADAAGSGKAGDAPWKR